VLLPAGYRALVFFGHLPTKTEKVKFPEAPYMYVLAGYEWDGWHRLRPRKGPQPRPPDEPVRPRRASGAIAPGKSHRRDTGRPSSATQILFVCCTPLLFVVSAPRSTSAEKIMALREDLGANVLAVVEASLKQE
jgi:hypothetical protein